MVPRKIEIKNHNIQATTLVISGCLTLLRVMLEKALVPTKLTQKSKETRTKSSKRICKRLTRRKSMKFLKGY